MPTLYKMLVFAQSHDVADARIIGDQLRISLHATLTTNDETVDVSTLDYVSTPHELKALLGY